MSPKRPGRRSAKRRPLTDQQERFCAELVRAPSAAQAAIRAGYSAASAKQQAHDLLHDKPISPSIRARVAELVAELQSAAGVTQERLENELTAVAFGDLRDLIEFGPDGIVVRPGLEIPPESAAALAEIRVEERLESVESKVLSGELADLKPGEQIQVETRVLHRRMGVKLHPKLQAIELLAKLRKFIRPSSPFGGGDGEGGPIIAVPVLLPAVRDA